MADSIVTPAPYTEADIGLIQRILPHRYPFLMVDKVRDIVPNKSAVGIKMVTVNEPHFQGHFPGQPVMPGVVVVEALAQTAAIVVAISRDLIEKDMLTYFMSMDKVKFRRMVVPGDMLELHVEQLRGGGKIYKFAGRAIVDGQLCCEAEFTAMMAARAEVKLNG